MKRRGSLALFGGPPGAAVDDLELSPIKAVELQASRLTDVVSLAQGIPSFDTPEPIKRYAADKIAEGACAKYSLTPGLPQLRELIGEALRHDGMQYDPDGEIVVTCGAIEAVTATLLAFVEPGDEVILASPTYASYIPAIQLAGGRPRFVALNEDANFDLDPDAIADAITRNTRAILLCNPNNPTGTIYSTAATERMMALAARHGLLVITDEVYKDFIYTNEPPGCPAKLPAHRDRVVRICSFSKAYGMTGWRVGFLHTARPLADAILKVHDTLVTCAPVVSQYAAIAALELGEPFIAQFREEFRRRRARIIERLDALPRVFDYQKPNASYFAFPRVKDTVTMARDSRALAADILERARVAVVPGVAFGPSGEAHLRFCYAREIDDIDRAFDRLTDYFAGRVPRAYAAVPPPPTPAPAAPHPLRQVAVETLHGLARLSIARGKPRIVAIAGGRGRTVLKRLLTELLAVPLRVRSNPLSYNTEVGVALGVLDITPDTRSALSLATGLARAVWHALFPSPVDVLVVELGVRQPGDMRRLLRIVQPDVAVITPLSPSYSDDQDGLTVLRNEMATLVEATRQRGGSVVLCGDDPALQAMDPSGAAHRFSTAALRERGGERWLAVEGQDYRLGREIVGDSSLYALTASAMVARLLGIAPDVVQRFLEREASALR